MTTTTPDFEAKARAIVDNWVYGELAKKDEDGLKRDISFALSLAFEEGLGCQAGHSAGCTDGVAAGAALHPDDGRDAYFGAHGKVLRSRALEHPESPLARDLLIAAGWVDALNFKLQQAQRPIEEAGTADEVSAANTSASLT